ncbi:Argininosuccinate synthase {ECO:0000255/HAMAP-Rule:MF_00005} [Methanothermobacter wolfeii]|uniref:Argininosuccinate synthase n=1 Tax=Methanothermobacter wolfeii TaxID=145261 RepID=A0A9E7RTV5_METWO|nr:MULTISPECIES: argininosuccinate synthase [Methanothermobacter]NLM02451.1 argininosuccinate synthase [Methanothermobacter wolfeii]QHN06983.1 argininosuccinate synthase [Methanothermobacter sp. THM-1]UXH31575.1 argininosuccinate synthase [Methanothermobacter wolfeii]SCM58464.1 Argininosuccinate synthase {ECO:0000255/HAMAP-Rule:MF_00005} [Methanothermobacter wolfeii]
MDKVVLAFSGGLDTSVCIKLLEEKYDMEVITACVDVGQPRHEIERPARVARELGNYRHHTIDAREEFASDYIFPAIKANAVYEGYPLSTALARPLIAKKIVEVAEKEGASAIAHGCTGKGNDQFRFEAVIRSTTDLDVIAPIRDLNLTRTEEMEYARSCGIPLPSDKLYSIDENLWGRAIEGDVLEDPAVEPPEDAFEWTKPVDETPEEPETVEIQFSGGVPVAINREELKPVEIVERANEIAGTHGIGRVDIMEDRIIGMKSREVYETPGACLLIEAHRGLEQLTLTRSELRFAEIISSTYAELVYNGLWHDPLREDLDMAINHMQRRVTGTVKVKLHRGNMRITGRSSPYSLYSEEIVSFEDKTLDQREMAGMVKNYALQAAIYRKVCRKEN